MLVTSAAEFLAAWSPERFPATAPATPRAAFLVTPLGFALAAESAQDNRYMSNYGGSSDSAADASTSRDGAADASRALAEHAALAAALRDCLPVIVFPGDAGTPDAAFPNNVFATAPGRVMVGAMRHAVRRREAARADIRAFFRDVLGYAVTELAAPGVVAELTGSLVIDRARGIGFCGLSERCNLAGAQAMHEAFGLKLTFAFELAAGEYHANVVLAQLASRALLIAPDGFAHAADAEAIARVYAPQVITLSAAQKADYAGNAIAVDPAHVWLSSRAAAALTPAQVDDLARWGFAVRQVDLAQIEQAGGSLRCCVGEIF